MSQEVYNVSGLPKHDEKEDSGSEKITDRIVVGILCGRREPA